MWMSLKFDKEYLFVFETLVFATSGILSMHKQFLTLQGKRKENLKSHHMPSLNNFAWSGTTETIEEYGCLFMTQENAVVFY